MTRKIKQGDIDWENINMIGFNPKYVPIPQGADARKPRVANALYLGIYPKNYSEAYFIDGIRISKHGGVEFLMKERDSNIPTLKEPICLIMELDMNTIQFIELDNILDAAGIKILQDWVTNENQTLLKIANEYEEYDRQFYHFMYDIICIAKAVTKWPLQDQKSFLNETKNATGLLHNRIQAEIFFYYKSNGISINLFPPKPNSTKKPDLQISNIFVDVKAILLTGRYHNKLLKNFKNRLKEILDKEKKNKQIGEEGTFFVTVWSGVVSSIFFTVYKKMKNNSIFAGVKLYDKIPALEEQKIVFVFPSAIAFQNYYLVVDRKRAVRILDYVAKKGYNKIQKQDSMSYLALINVRKGCSFGVTGSAPMIMFKLT